MDNDKMNKIQGSTISLHIHTPVSIRINHVNANRIREFSIDSFYVC